MPIFDYRCSECNITEERMVKSHDDPQSCPKCTKTMQKQLSCPTFVLKGKGFTNSGTYANSANGPKLDKDFLKLPEKEMNKELGLPENCDL